VLIMHKKISGFINIIVNKPFHCVDNKCLLRYNLFRIYVSMAGA
jgi:hypothetical protein